MSAEPRVRVRRVLIRVPRAAEDDGDLDSALEALLPESKALELLEAVPLCRAVDDGIPKEVFAHAGDVYCGLDGTAAIGVFWVGGGFSRILEFPRVAVLVVQQAGVIVALLQPTELVSAGEEERPTYVEVLENTGRDLWCLVW